VVAERPQPPINIGVFNPILLLSIYHGKNSRKVNRKEMGFTTLILDFDGVIRHWLVIDVHEKETLLGIEPGTLHKMAFQERYLLPAITGKISHHQWMLEVCNEFHKRFNQVSVEQIHSIWKRAKWSIDDRLVPEIRAKYPELNLVLASNATNLLRKDLKTAKLLDEFDSILNSSELGVAKPDCRFYQEGLEKLHICPQQAIFVDDQGANVQAAQNFGIRSFEFVSKVDLYNCLNELIRVNV